LVFQVTGIVVLPDDGAHAPKHVGDTHSLYVYNCYCAFSWYLKGVWYPSWCMSKFCSATSGKIHCSFSIRKWSLPSKSLSDSCSLRL